MRIKITQNKFILHRIDQFAIFSHNYRFQKNIVKIVIAKSNKKMIITIIFFHLSYLIKFHLNKKIIILTCSFSINLQARKHKVQTNNFNNQNKTMNNKIKSTKRDNNRILNKQLNQKNQIKSKISMNNYFNILVTKKNNNLNLMIRTFNLLILTLPSRRR